MSNDKTAEEIELEKNIWNAIRENWYSSSVDGHILPVKKVVYDYSAQQLKEYREVIRELLPFIEHEYGMQVDYYGSETLTTKSTLKKLDRARKLIDQTDSAK